MNFFSHSCVAAWRSEHPRFLLGAMLPDLSAMLGVRIRELFDTELRAGVEHHHATDAAFHAAPVFTQLCGEGIARLTGDGVERGTARAVAHVGVELLLDGVLSHDGAACVRYRHALDSTRETPLDAWLALRDPEHLQELRAGIVRLSAAPIPEGYREAEFVCERLRYILARRPRLAMRDADQKSVLGWLNDVHASVIDQHELLLSQVQSALPADASAR